MIISSPEDFRAVAEARLPRFLFDYIDGGAYAEQTLKRNVSDFGDVKLRQRVLKGSDKVSLETRLLGEELKLPIILAPVGLTGMYARRGEAQAARAAESMGIATTLSTVSICPIEEVAAASSRPIWFQLYVLKDREFMKNVLARALEAGVQTLVFTVDLPVPGARYRDAHSGLGGPNAGLRRLRQIVEHPQWAWDVGLKGAPLELGNISAYLGKSTKFADFIVWIAKNFDPAISWKDVEWVRDYWPGNLVVKGILDPEDAEDAIRLGADGIVVSNHGGRQLDGVSSSITALPRIVDTVAGRTKILMDSGIRSGLDVVRAMCLGADAVMIGRAYIYALAAGGQKGVETLLSIMASEMRVAMVLTGAASLDELGPDLLDTA